MFSEYFSLVVQFETTSSHQNPRSPAKKRQNTKQHQKPNQPAWFLDWEWGCMEINTILLSWTGEESLGKT